MSIIKKILREFNTDNSSSEEISNECLTNDIVNIITRLGASFHRLKKFHELKAPEVIIDSERGILKKYLRVIEIRSDEFNNFMKFAFGVNKINSITKRISLSYKHYLDFSCNSNIIEVLYSTKMIEKEDQHM